jgi:type II secretory pathway pseudopilin PulG
MPILSAGRVSRRKARERGITLLEMVVVASLIAIMVAVTFPSVGSGLDTLRINAATNDIVTFINTGLDRSARRQQVIEITILKTENAMQMRSSDPGFTRRMDLPEGIVIERVLPELSEQSDAPRSFMLYPGGTVPRIGVQIANKRKVQRIVQVDPITGVPIVIRPDFERPDQ